MPTVRIESIAAGGDGVARHEGLVVFTPRTAPGELVEVEIRQHGRLARGRLLRIVEPAPARLPPRCRHYDGDRCGGCQLQHLTTEAQRDAKRRIVADAFSRIARRIVEVPDVVPSVSDWEYRSRLTLALRRRGDHWVMGLHTYDEVERVFDLRECPITDGRVVRAWMEIRDASDILPRATELRGTVRLIGDALALIIEGGTTWPGARDFASRVPSLSVVRWRPDRGATRVIMDRRSGGLPEESFDQVNQPVAAAARRELIDRALAMTPKTAVDAYAGLGQTTRALSERGVAVTAIESDPSAAAWAAQRLPAPARMVTGRVEDLIAQFLPADVVIMNPPRAGVDAHVTAALQASVPRHVLYMSCDAATLARDVSRLGAYRVKSVRAFDMFPQTAHVEVVCELVPEGA